MSGACFLGVAILGICVGISDQDIARNTITIDGTCDLRQVQMPAADKARYLDDAGRPNATLTPSERAYVLTLVGNNRIWKQRCGAKPK